MIKRGKLWQSFVGSKWHRWDTPTKQVRSIKNFFNIFSHWFVIKTVLFVCRQDKNKQKEAGDGTFFFKKIVWPFEMATTGGIPLDSNHILLLMHYSHGSLTSSSAFSVVWPDWAKFRHFGTPLYNFGHFESVHVNLALFWANFGKFNMQLGRFSLL